MSEETTREFERLTRATEAMTEAERERYAETNPQRYFGQIDGILLSAN